jgi:hypothetical protein
LNAPLNNRRCVRLKDIQYGIRKIPEIAPHHSSPEVEPIFQVDVGARDSAPYHISSLLERLRSFSTYNFLGEKSSRISKSHPINSVSIGKSPLKYYDSWMSIGIIPHAYLSE